MLLQEYVPKHLGFEVLGRGDAREGALAADALAPDLALLRLVPVRRAAQAQPRRQEEIRRDLGATVQSVDRVRCLEPVHCALPTTKCSAGAAERSRK